MGDVISFSSFNRAAAAKPARALDASDAAPRAVSYKDAVKAIGEMVVQGGICDIQVGLVDELPSACISGAKDRIVVPSYSLGGLANKFSSNVAISAQLRHADQKSLKMIADYSTGIRPQTLQLG